MDWLIPGILAMNMMFNALFGVGYTIVRYRKSGVLKRLKATPVKAFEFLAARIASRVLLIQVTSLGVYIGCNALVHFQMRGSYLLLFLYLSLGGLSMISLSTVVAARIRSEELAEGILNLLTWPMMLFSGVWFSLEGTNPTLQKIGPGVSDDPDRGRRARHHDRRGGASRDRASRRRARRDDGGLSSHRLVSFPLELRTNCGGFRPARPHHQPAMALAPTPVFGSLERGQHQGEISGAK